jgi:hypothetical protein
MDVWWKVLIIKWCFCYFSLIDIAMNTYFKIYSYQKWWRDRVIIFWCRMIFVTETFKMYDIIKLATWLYIYNFQQGADVKKRQSPRVEHANKIIIHSSLSLTYTESNVMSIIDLDQFVWMQIIQIREEYYVSG